MRPLHQALRRHPLRDAPFANRNFLGLWVSQAVTQTSANVVNYSLLVLAQSLTNSSTQVGLIILSFSLPAVLFSTLAGVLVDRWDKRVVMVASNAVRGIAVLTYVFAQGAEDMPWVYMASFIFATATQFFAPAEGSVIPRLVGRKRLIAANSLYNLTNMAAQFLGFTVIGWLLVRTLGLTRLFIVVSVIYICAAALIGFLRIPLMRATPKQGSALSHMWDDLVEGWSYIAARRSLLATIVHLSIANSTYLLLGTLAPAFVLLVLKVRAEDLGVLLVPAGLSTLAGAISVSRLARPENRHKMIHGGLVGVGVAVMGLAGLSPLTRLGEWISSAPVPLSIITLMAVILSVAFGYSAAFIAIPAQTLMQESSTDEIRGRVLSTFFTVSNAAAFVAILLAGSLADRLGVVETMAISGSAILAVGLYSQYRYSKRGYTPKPSRESLIR